MAVAGATQGRRWHSLRAASVMAMLERSGQGEASAAGAAMKSDRATAATAAR